MIGKIVKVILERSSINLGLCGSSGYGEQKMEERYILNLLN
jgi:hypothetical protein